MLLAFLDILSMCGFQDRVDCRSTPRYFVTSSVSRMCPFSLYEVSDCGASS